MGELRRRGRVWWVRYYRNGRRFEESSKSTKQEDAKRLLRDREGDIAKGVPVSPAIGRFTFEEAAKDLLTDYQVNGRRSIKHVERRINAGLTPWFRGRRLANLTTADVRAYTAHRLEHGAANATINRELAALKRMFTLAMQAGKVLRRPYIPLLQEDNVRRGFFEREQFEQVRAHLPKALRAIATVAYYTGWRTQSEILPLEWHQIDRQAGTIRLEPGTTKNREGRLFVYAAIDELRDAIEAQWKAHAALEKKGTLCPWVFQRHGKPVHYFRRAWRTACRNAGCPGRILHDFRRTAVRNLVRAGNSEKVAMVLTGHKTRSVFDRYDIVNEEDLATAARKLQALVGTISGTVTDPDDSGGEESVENGQIFGVLNGDPGGDRTHGPVIKSSSRKKTG